MAWALQGGRKQRQRSVQGGSVKTGEVLKKAFNTCRLKAWNVRQQSKNPKQCKTTPKTTPPLLESSIYQYASEDDPVTVSSQTDHNHSISQSPNSFMVSPPTAQSLSLSIPVQSPTTPLRCSTSISQHCNSPNNPICASSLCSNDSFPNYWVKELELIDKGRAELVNGEWLSDELCVLLTNFSIYNFQPLMAFRTLLSCMNALDISWVHKTMFQIINISQSHWVCASNMLSPPGVVEVYDSMPAY